MESFVKLIGYITVSIISFFLGGYAIQQLWQWFVLPVFHLPVLMFLQGVGLCMTVRYFTHQQIVTVEPEDATTIRIVASIVLPLVVLFIGWAIHSSM